MEPSKRGSDGTAHPDIRISWPVRPEQHFLLFEAPPGVRGAHSTRMQNWPVDKHLLLTSSAVGALLHTVGGARNE